MVKMGQSAERIRRVRFAPPTSAFGDVEVNTLKGIRDRGGPREFLDIQRLDFDLLIQIESGTALHTVDFTGFHLGPGDVLWVRAGQVQQWGRIEDIEGPVVLFGSHAVDDRTHDLIRAQAVRPRSHWPPRTSLTRRSNRPSAFCSPAATRSRPIAASSTRRPFPTPWPCSSSS